MEDFPAIGFLLTQKQKKSMVFVNRPFPTTQRPDMTDEQEMYLELVPLEEGKRRYVFNLVRVNGELLYHHSTLYLHEFFPCGLLNNAIFTIVQDGFITDKAVYHYHVYRNVAKYWFDGFLRVIVGGRIGMYEALSSDQFREGDVVIVDVVSVLDDELISRLRRSVIESEVQMQVHDEYGENGPQRGRSPIRALIVKKEELMAKISEDTTIICSAQTDRIHILDPGESI